ncbi:hypothetical protein MMC2321_00230 [Chitinophaga sp. MM2321]
MIDTKHERKETIKEEVGKTGKKKIKKRRLENLLTILSTKI